MGNKPTGVKYEKIFDPKKFDIEGHIKYHQFIEKNYPFGNIAEQIDKCSKYFINTSSITNLEGYMNEGTYILALIRQIKKQDIVQNNEEMMQYYDKMYKEIYDILISIG